MSAIDLEVNVEKNVENAITHNNITLLKQIKPEVYIAFKHEMFRNIFLFSVAKGTLESVKIVVQSLQAADKFNVVAFVNSTDSNDRTALMLASMRDDVSMAQYLIFDLNFYIQFRNKNGLSALTVAMYANCQKTFNYLLLLGSALETNEQRALYLNRDFSQYFNSPECFLIIIQTKNISAFHTIIHHIKSQPEQLQRRFLECIDSDGRNALILAAFLRQIEMVLTLTTLAFKLEVRDRHGHCAISYLIAQGQTTYAINLLSQMKSMSVEYGLAFSRQSHQFIQKTKSSKKRISDAITFTPDKYVQCGRISKAYDKEILRLNRSFREERERQLLRQVATQIYFPFSQALEAMKVEGLVEIQLLHMNFKGKSFLFLAANNYSVTEHLPGLIFSSEHLSSEHLRCILTTRHYVKNDKEGNVRSERHAKKLVNRIYSDNPRVSYANDDDKIRTEEVVRILRGGAIRPLPILLETENAWSQNSKNTLRQVLLHRGNEIYVMVIQRSPNKSRHAEEFLVDIRDFAVQLKTELSIADPIYTCIGGKKRPCMGCSGRMHYQIDQYSQRPGRFWSNTIVQQSDIAAQNTVTLLLSKPSYVSQSRDRQLLRDYDSGSDSEIEVPEVGRRLV